MLSSPRRLRVGLFLRLRLGTREGRGLLGVATPRVESDGLRELLPALHNFTTHTYIHIQITEYLNIIYPYVYFYVNIYYIILI